MLISVLKSKIHRATVTDANLNYTGSITIDQKIIDSAHLYVGEKVDVVNINNGARFSTYILAGQKGEIILNGAAARMVQRGDLLIIMSYALLDPQQEEILNPTIVHLDEHNAII